MRSSADLSPRVTAPSSIVTSEAISTHHIPPAVYREHLACDGLRFLPQEKQGRARDFPRGQNTTAERLFFLDERGDRRIVLRAGAHGRFHEAWRDGIDANPVRCVIGCHRRRERDDRAFA